MTPDAPASAVIRDIAARLAAVGVPNPSADARELVSHVTGLSPGALLTAKLSGDDSARLESLVRQRLARIPLQHLTGTAYFRYLELAVGPGVFIPRPETEVLVDAALSHLTPQATVVDLCAGSGAIGLSLAVERPGSSVICVEKDPQALTWLRKNVNATAGRMSPSTVQVVAGDVRLTDWWQQAGIADASVDVIVTNPPYIPTDAIPRAPEVSNYDPSEALYGGEDGLDIIRPIVENAFYLLRPGGWLLIEHADSQGTGEHGVPQVVARHSGFTNISDHLDLTGRPRFTQAQRR